MREIFPGILQWSWFSQEKGCDFNGHLLILGNQRVLIDPPPFSAADLETVEKHKPISYILLTNRDHVREAEGCRQHFKCRVLAPELDAPLMGITVDGTFRDGDILPGGLRAIHIPNNKSPGETAFFLNRQKGILIVGDAVVGKPPGQLSLMPADRYKDIRQAKNGLKVLLRYRFDAILPGDGAPILAGAGDILNLFLKESHA